MYSIVYNPLVLLYCNLPKGSQALLLQSPVMYFLGMKSNVISFLLV